MTDVVPSPATAVPEAGAVVTTVQTSDDPQRDPDIPGRTTTVGYVMGPAMVMDGKVVDATNHPITFPIYMAVAGDSDDSSEPFDPSGYLAVWEGGHGKPETGSWSTQYRSPALPGVMRMLFDPAPEVEPDFATWVNGIIRPETAVVLSEGVTGRASSFPGNAVVMAVVLGQESSDTVNGLLTWQLNPALQIGVSSDGTVRAYYGSEAIAAHQVFTPVAARPLVIGAAVIDRKLVMVVCDGTTTVMRSQLPRDAQLVLEAPLLIGQVVLDNEVFYGDVALLRFGMARLAAERELVALVTDMAAEYEVVLIP